MADIKLVINISEDSYKATCNGYMLPQDVENVVNAIKNGTPSPERHGDPSPEGEDRKTICRATIN